MRGLEAEFERFSTICLEGASPAEIENVKRMFMAGALAQADRILNILTSDLSLKRKAALMRRISRECATFQLQTIREAEMLDE